MEKHNKDVNLSYDLYGNVLIASKVNLSCVFEPFFFLLSKTPYVRDVAKNFVYRLWYT